MCRRMSMKMKNETPLVSIQCLAYNHEKYIRQCLDAIVMQKTTFPFEAVVHDDASTDNTAHIIREYADRYPNIIRPIFEHENLFSKDKKKMRQILYEHMHGAFIAFCECDDYWTDPDKLQKQIEFLQSHSDYSMCFHSARKQYETENQSWLNCEYIEDRDYTATEVFVNWIVPTASIVCRREAWQFRFNLIGGDRILNGDIALILSCMMTGKVRGMSEQMSVYRIQGGGVTYDKNAKKERAMRAPYHFECLRDNFPIVDSGPIDDTIAKTYFERALIQNSFIEKIKDFSRSIKNNPRRFFSMALHTIWMSLKGKV